MFFNREAKNVMRTISKTQNINLTNYKDGKYNTYICTKTDKREFSVLTVKIRFI